MPCASPTSAVVGAVVGIAVVVAAAVCGVATPAQPPPAPPQVPVTLLSIPEPEWREPIDLGGHRPTSQWLFPVRRGRILYQPPLQLSPGLPLGSVFKSAQAAHADAIDSATVQQTLWAFCRDCASSTFVAASLTAGPTIHVAAYWPKHDEDSMLAMPSRAPPPATAAVAVRSYTWLVDSATNFHIAVPFACLYSQLHAFLRAIAPSLAVLPAHRVHVGWATCTNGGSDEAAAAMAAAAAVAAEVGVSMTIVPTRGPFSRASTLNAAARGAADGDIVVAVDVDMTVGVPFFLAAAAFTARGVSAYFPAVWSTYNPDVVRAERAFLGRAEEGLWRWYGYGMVAMYKSDLDAVGGWSTKFTQWGGEDNDLHSRARRRLRVVRMNDNAMVHHWHGKDCGHTSSAGGVAGRREYARCMGSKFRVEGSGLGVLLHHCGHAAVSPEEPSTPAVAESRVMASPHQQKAPDAAQELDMFD